MKDTYRDLIQQTFDFPQGAFDLKNGQLTFHGVDLSDIIKQYGTPLRLSYLPSIGQQIRLARRLFATAIANHRYDGDYHYCYCTKSCHFKYVMDEVLRENAHIETSSSFDMDVISRLLANGQIKRGTKIVCNGFKPKDYLAKIVAEIHKGYHLITPVLDNMEEFDYYEHHVTSKFCNIGIRVATEEEPLFHFYTSRLGIRHAEVLDFYKNRISKHPRFKLRMLHFFVDTGIKDSIYYWDSLKKCVRLYIELKHICPSLRALNIGGGLPIKNSLGSEYDYAYMIDEIVGHVAAACMEEGMDMPDIYTEFGTFTVGESGAHIFSVIGRKQQNDSELWYMIDNSIMNTLPDTWGIDQRFITLPINKWGSPPTRANIGGITCDNSDYYNSDAHVGQLFLPEYPKADVEPLYIGFFHTGAYQESISGYGGIKHCLIPSPRHVLIDRDDEGRVTHRLLNEQQDADSMLRVLGY